MADRNVRDAIILSKAESTYGTDPTPTAADNAQLVSNFSVTPLNAQNVSRDLIRGFLGGAEALVGDRYVSAQYGIEAVGSGTAGTAPAWGDQLLACGFAETETATTRVDYTLVSTAFGSLTNYYHDSGVKHVSTGTRGSFDLRLELGDQHKANVAIVKLTDEILTVQNAIDKIRAKGDEVTAQDSATLTQLERRLKAAREEVKLHQSYSKTIEAQAKAQEAAKPKQDRELKGPVKAAEESEYQKLAKRIQEQIALDQQQLAGGAALTEFEKFRVKTLQEMGDARKKLTEAEKSALWVQLLEAEAADNAVRKQKSEYDQALAIAQARQALRNDEYKAGQELTRQALEDSNTRNRTARETLENIEFETRLLGMNNAEREQAVAMRELERAGIRQGTDAWDAYAAAIQRAIGDRAAMQKQIDDFQSIWGSIDRTAQQTFTNIFEGGQDAFTKLRDTLKATLLDLLYQMTVRKWVFNLAANVTGASSGVAGTVGQASGLSGIGGVGSLIGSGSSLGMFGQAASATMQNGLIGGFGANMSNIATLAEGGSLLGAAGAAMPYIGAALAVASLLESDKGGPKTIGGAADAATIQATVAATLATFGVSASGLRVGGFSAADPQGDSLTQLQTALFQGDRALYSRQERLGDAGYENVGRSSEELAAAWAEEQSRIMLAALQATLEPKYQQYISDVSADASGVEAINAALARLNAARTLEEQLLTLSSTDAENMARARQRELDAMDAALRPLQQRLYTLQDEARITGKINDVMADYLSDTELRAARIWQIHQQLGKAGLDISLDRIASATRNDLRALYEEMVRIGDMGAAEALLDVAGAFAQITEPANQAATAIEDMAQRLQDAGRGVWDYLRTLTATRAGTASPMALLNGTRSNYLQDLSLARAGDVDAYGRINSSAQAYIEAQKGYTASGGSTHAVISQIISELSGLAAVQSYEQQNLALLGQIAQATGATSTSTGGSKVTGDQILARLMQDSLLSYSRAEAASVYNSIANNTGNSVSYLANIAYHSQLMANQLISGVMNVRSEYRAGALASFDVGTPYVPHDMVAKIHRGEAIMPARVAQRWRDGESPGGAGVEARLEALAGKLDRLTAVVAAGANANLGKQDAIVTNTRRVADRAELMAARP